MRTNAAKQYNGKTGFSLVKLHCLVTSFKIRNAKWVYSLQKFFLNETNKNLSSRSE